MATLLKNIYDKQFFDGFITTTKEIVPDFNASSFLRQIYDKHWDDMALKQRMRQITIALNDHLSPDYKKNINIIITMIGKFQKNRFREGGFEFMFLPDFIELFGLDDYETSIGAMEHVTPFASCEFAIRPFILKYEERVLIELVKWSKHENEHIRRLASEGCRPRLPWAMALPKFKDNPAPILPILNTLKNDPSEYVRRSTANNLNDISKDNPQVVVEIAQQWIGYSNETDKLIKHACRTLLKQGNKTILSLFGLSDTKNINIKDVEILTHEVSIGDALEFTFIIENKANSTSKIRLEYGLFYQKANGSLSKKVFKISEKEYSANSSTVINRKQPFKIITTRKFHTGKHGLSIIINGNESDIIHFDLVE